MDTLHGGSITTTPQRQHLTVAIDQTINQRPATTGRTLDRAGRIPHLGVGTDSGCLDLNPQGAAGWRSMQSPARSTRHGNLVIHYGALALRLFKLDSPSRTWIGPWSVIRIALDKLTVQQKVMLALFNDQVAMPKLVRKVNAKNHLFEH